MKVKVWMVEHYACRNGRNSSTSWFYSSNLNKDIEYSIRQHIQELHEDGCEYQSCEHGIFDLESFRKSISNNSSYYLIPVD
jgi:hypothetical protein